MLKPAEFLSKYDILLFDMDGVITSEERYWDCAVLSVYEYLNPDCDPAFTMENIADIRKNIMCSDKTIVYLKNKGVNSNWDLAYIVLSTALMLDEKEEFSKILDFIKDLGMGAMEMYEYFAKKSPLGERGREKYKQACVLTFQEWYLGDEKFEEIWGEKPKKSNKPGLYQKEEPIIPIEKLKAILKTLHTHGFKLGVGTGRVKFEAEFPLENWDIKKYFDLNRIVTYTNVIEAERKIPDSTFTKPHPYMFIKGMLGVDYSDEEIAKENYDKTLAKKTLVIGDAGADILAAKAAKMDFAAVLTGVSGEDARGYFEDQKAEYILNDICDTV